VVGGVRSHYVKLAALQPPARASRSARWVFVDTGQHYDPALAQQYRDEYGLVVDHALGCGRPDASPVRTLAAMLVACEELLHQLRPDACVVLGDANTALAASLAAARLRIPLAHLEAGVRTPSGHHEELNRTLVDDLAGLHVATSARDLRVLEAEGRGATSRLGGDLTRDLCLAAAAGPAPPVEKPYALVTLHRTENTTGPEVLRAAVAAVEDAGLPGVLVLHPRVHRLAARWGLRVPDGWQVHESLPHRRMLRLLRSARVVVTDSGALQRECFYLNVRAVVVQDFPFWPELTESGFHVAVAPDGDIGGALSRALRPAPRVDVDFGPAPAGPASVALVEEWVCG
jgi:UDP-N-acetylglucosamine 2-epimerase